MIDKKDISKGTAAMKAGRYLEAIAVYEATLKKHPDDLKTLLHLGICHLLNRSDKVFLAIYDKAKQLKERMDTIPEDVSRVFNHYEGLVKRVSASALLMGAVSTTMTACGDEDDPATSSHKYSGGVYVDNNENGTDTAKPDAGDDTVDTTSSAHRYSGGVYVDATDE